MIVYKAYVTDKTNMFNKDEVKTNLYRRIIFANDQNTFVNNIT